MLETLPNLVIADPPIRPCYAMTGLSQWRQASHQSVHAQYWRGRLFGVVDHGVVVYPSCQFNRRGQVRPDFHELLVSPQLIGRDALNVAVRLHTPDPMTGRTPTAELAASDSDPGDHIGPLSSSLNMVEPPTGSFDGPRANSEASIGVTGVVDETTHA